VTKTICHEDEEEQREPMTLKNASKGKEGFKGRSIDHDGEERGEDERHNPFNPWSIKAKGF